MICLLSIISVIILIRVPTKDKQTEYEARRFITQAHERGNVSVRKVVDYTRQQIGYKFNACKTTKRAQTTKNHTLILSKTILSSFDLKWPLMTSYFDCRFNLLLTKSEHQRCFETPAKTIQRTPKTVQHAPQAIRIEPKLEQVASLMASLGMNDTSENHEETELVQNDALWMKEMMTVWKNQKKMRQKLAKNWYHYADAHEMPAKTNCTWIKATVLWR